MSKYEENNTSSSALIVGCGYVGRVLARTLCENGVRVFGSVRHEHVVPSVKATGAIPLICDVTNTGSLDALSPALNESELSVFYLVPPGGRLGPAESQRIVVDGARNVLAQLKGADVRRVVMASSTGVYGHTSGEIVDASTPPEPKSDRARLLVEGEQVWLNSSLDCHIVRLAGLYGPDRVVGLGAIRQNSALVGQGDAWLNLVHVDDAVDALITIMQSDSAAPIELVSDGTPVQRLAYYNELARRVDASPVRMIDDEAELRAMGLDAARIRSTGLSKRCDPTSTMERTGWSPLYPNFQAGFETLAEVVLKLGL